MSGRIDREKLIDLRESNGEISSSSNAFNNSNPKKESYSSSVGTTSSSSRFRYEELLDGCVPCPSCNGQGRVSRELEGQLVAIIPLTDDRLKPRRTVWWVLLAIVVCCLIGGLLTFFLFPRSVSLDSDSQNLVPYNLTDVSQLHEVLLGVVNNVRLTNHNYYDVTVVNVSTVVTADKFFSTDVVIGSTYNTAAVNVPMLTTVSLVTNVGLTVGRYSMDLYYQCKYATWIYVQFQFTVTVSYMGHVEQDTKTTHQKLCCALNMTTCVTPWPEAMY